MTKAQAAGFDGGILNVLARLTNPKREHLVADKDGPFKAAICFPKRGGGV